jgi:hypothetical protein
MYVCMPAYVCGCIWSYRVVNNIRNFINISFFPRRWDVSSTQECVPISVSIFRIPQMVEVWRATVE